MRELEEHKISTWRSVFEANGNVKPFVTIDPSESLQRAVEMLCEEKIHRLPVLDQSTGNISYILTHKRLIKFLFLYVSFITSFILIIIVEFRLTICLNLNLWIKLPKNLELEHGVIFQQYQWILHLLMLSKYS